MDIPSAAIIAAAAAIITMTVQLVVGLISKVSDRRHELRRDQFTRYYELRVGEYTERRAACQSLIVSMYQMTTSGAGDFMLRLAKELNLPVSSDADETAKLLSQNASKFGQDAIRILSVDRRAKGILEAYSTLPIVPFMQNPLDKEANQTWADRVDAVREAVHTYLEEIRADLVPPQK